MRVHLVNPSDTSFGTAVITPRWLYVLAAATPASFGDPVICDETLEHLDPMSIAPGDVVGIGIHTGNALRGYRIGLEARERGATVIFGGIHSTLYPEEAFARGGAVGHVASDLGEALSFADPSQGRIGFGPRSALLRRARPVRRGDEDVPGANFVLRVPVHRRICRLHFLVAHAAWLHLVLEEPHRELLALERLADRVHRDPLRIEGKCRNISLFDAVDVDVTGRATVEPGDILGAAVSAFR